MCEAWITIVSHALRWTVGGIAVGIFGTVISARFLGSFLFEVSPEDSILFAAAALFLLVTAIMATLLPALKASRIDPVVVLREE